MSRTDKDIPRWVAARAAGEAIAHTWVCTAGLRPCSAGQNPAGHGCTYPSATRTYGGPPRRYRRGALHGREDRARVRDRLREIVVEVHGARGLDGLGRASGSVDAVVEPGCTRVDARWSWLD